MAGSVLTIYFLFTVIHFTSALNVNMQQKVYEFARGTDGVMQCNFKPEKPSNPLIIIDWSANADSPDNPEISILTYTYNAAASDNTDYGDYSTKSIQKADVVAGTSILTLQALTAQDNRTFNCKVTIPGDGKGNHMASAKMVVLVAPSKPTCTIQGKTEFGQNITIACLSQEGTPIPTYKWTSSDTTNTSRPLPLRATDVNGVLSLYNLSAATNGYFVCTSTNKVGSASCNTTLVVTAPSLMSTAATAGLIGAAVAALLFLIVLIYCCCCRRKKEEQFEECEMEAPEGEGLTEKAPREREDRPNQRLESKPDQRDQYEQQSDRFSERGVNYDARQDRPDDRRNDRYDDRQSDRYDDRRSDRYDDRQSDRYDDRRSDRYDDRRSDRDDRRNDRYDEPTDDRRYDRRDR